MPRKKTVQKRTPGFTTIDKEIHDVLDTIRPVAERVYRKLTQRVNIKRGDRTAYPTWEQLITETGISNRRTLDRAIKELESAHLIVVDRSYNADLKRKNVNRYYIVPTSELSQWQIYQEPVANLQKASGKTATVTRMKRTSMNITRMNKGTGDKKKKKVVVPSSPSPLPVSLMPGVNKHEQGQWQNGTGSGVRALSVDEIKQRQIEWDKKQRKTKK
jgi:hypothetical protein